MWPRYVPLPSTILLTAILVILAGYVLGNDGSDTSLLSSGTESQAYSVHAEPDSTEFQRASRPASFYQAILERPLFSPSRRPESLEIPVETNAERNGVDEPVEVDIRQPDFTLHGTIATGGSGSALIAIDQEPPTWLRQQSSISGWVLSKVTPKFIELENESGTITVFLFEER